MEISFVWANTAGGVNVLQIRIGPCMAASQGSGEWRVRGPWKG